MPNVKITNERMSNLPPLPTHLLIKPYVEEKPFLFLKDENVYTPWVLLDHVFHTRMSDFNRGAVLEPIPGFIHKQYYIKDNETSLYWKWGGAVVNANTLNANLDGARVERQHATIVRAFFYPESKVLFMDTHTQTAFSFGDRKAYFLGYTTDRFARAAIHIIEYFF